MRRRSLILVLPKSASRQAIQPCQERWRGTFLSIWLTGTFLILFAAWPGQVSATVAYLLIQGNFDTASPALEASRWQVNYNGSALSTAQDLLDAVFGSPKLVSGNHYRTDPTQWTNDQTIWQVDYTLYAGFGYLVNGFIRNTIGNPGPAQSLFADFGTDQGWSYYNGGGGYVDAFFYDPLTDDYTDGPHSGPYSDGTWTLGYTGIGQRSLGASGGFDGWVYGNDGFGAATPQATVSGFIPTSPSFSSASLNAVNVGAAPEPSRFVLLLAAGMRLACRRRRPSLF